MGELSSLGFLLGSSWASGINLYLTVAGLGIAQRMEWIQLPGNLEVLGHPLVIAVAVILCLIEFVADKVPYVDSTWDAAHTFIRPVGGLTLGYMAMNGADPSIQMATALVTGTVAFNSHITKATARAAINTSPEPITNSVASVTEDVSVIGVLYLISTHPVIAGILVVIFIIFSVWFLKVMFRFVKKIFSRKPPEPVSKVVSESKDIGK